MTAADLSKLLTAAHAAGLRCLNYHHHGNISESEWTVVSAMCGDMWRPGQGKYTPPDKLVI
jgi:hypothetical protein